MADFSGYGMPAVDFGGLGQLGDIYNKAKLGAARERTLAELGQGKLDYGRAAQALLAAGDTEGGLSLARLAESQSNRAEDRAYREKQFNENVRQFNVGQEGGKVPAGFQRGESGVLAPISGGPADPAYIKQQSEAKVGGGLLDADTIGQMAEQYRAGDTSVLTNLGRGSQGAENIKLLRQEIVKQNNASGVTGAEQAIRNAEYFGTKAGQRTVGTKGANIELAATEFNQVLPVVQEASKAVNRTQYSDLNKIIQAFEQRTGDPNIVKFGGGINTLINLYARAVSPTGVGTVSDKDHARELLQRAWSQGQFDAAVGMMKQEIDAALASPEKVRDEMRRRFLGGAGAPGATSGGGQAAPPATTRPTVPPPPSGFVVVP